MLTKLGVASLGVAAGLTVFAPAASADDGKHSRNGGHEASRHCETTAGDASAASEINGETVAAAVAQAPVAGSNTGNISCSDVASHNEDILSHNDVVPAS